ncbi:5324_t:CDS:1, partial [Acaulospora colombiana]
SELCSPPMSWFPNTLDKAPSWHFDAISLVAVLGDSTITEHAQTLTASSLCLIPRLIPAPQALVKTTRPSRLPAVPAIIFGVHSGTRIDELNFYANLIHDIGSLKPLQFKAYKITRNLPASESEKARVRDNEKGEGIQYKVVQAQATGTNVVKPTVFIRTWSPLNFISVGSVLLTIGLIVWACLLHDGVGVIALSAMSFSALFVGLASRWSPRLTMRPTNAACPPGDIVIRTREGAFVVVECVEEITRELYTGTEYADYWISDRY